MSQLIYNLAVSLDGFIAAGDGSVAFLDAYNTEGPEDYGLGALMESCQSVLMGANTYAHVLEMLEGKDPYPEHRTYVFTSRDLPEPTQGELVRIDPVAFVRQLKSWEEDPIWLVGGGQLAGSLLEARLIDRLEICVAPDLLGDGVRLFGGQGAGAKWALEDTKAYPSGLVRLRYKAA